MIAKADCKDVYDHRLVRLCVDLKFNLFGSFLYLIILCCQSLYVALYTGVALSSPTPSNQGYNYYQMTNYTCFDLCIRLANDPIRPEPEQTTLRALRLILLIVSSCALLKELFQVVTQREKYFRKFYINLIELHMYVSKLPFFPKTIEIVAFHSHVIRLVQLFTLWMSMNVRVKLEFVVPYSG